MGMCAETQILQGIGQYDQRTVSLAKIETSVLRLFNFLFCRNRKETYLKDFLYDGPVNRPQLKNLNFEIQRYKAEQRRNAIEATLKRLKYEFHQNVSEMMVTFQEYSNLPCICQTFFYFPVL